MQISLSEIRTAGGYLEKAEEIDPSELDLIPDEDMRLIGPVRAEVQLTQHQDRVFARLEVLLAAEGCCSRCLETFQFEPRGTFSGEFIPEDGEEDDETVGVYGYDQLLDLREFIRESVLMLFPIKKLCREQCRGICPECGTNLNYNQCDCKREHIDPRWGALEKARKKLQQS